MPRATRMLTACATALLAWTGCAATSDEDSRRLSPSRTPDGLAKVSSRGPGALYVKPNHPVGSYDETMVPAVGILYAPGQEELTEEQENLIFDRMIGRLYEGLPAGLGSARQPGPCILKMGVYLKDVTFYESSTSGSQTRFVTSYGSATVVFELRDSVTDEALVRYGQRRSLGSGVDAGGVRGPDLQRLGDTLDPILDDLGESLHEVITPSPEASAARGCEGELGRAFSEQG